MWAEELSNALKPKGLLLSAAVSASQPTIDKAYDVPSLSKNLDFINVMTYDFHGHWDKKTGHVSPLYAHADDAHNYLNTVSKAINKTIGFCDVNIYMFEKEVIIILLS